MVPPRSTPSAAGVLVTARSAAWMTVDRDRRRVVGAVGIVDVGRHRRGVDDRAGRGVGRQRGADRQGARRPGGDGAERAHDVARAEAHSSSDAVGREDERGGQQVGQHDVGRVGRAGVGDRDRERDAAAGRRRGAVGDLRDGEVGAARRSASSSSATTLVVAAEQRRRRRRRRVFVDLVSRDAGRDRAGDRDRGPAAPGARVRSTTRRSQLAAHVLAGDRARPLRRGRGGRDETGRAACR